jgi:hypothetical protein
MKKFGITKDALQRFVRSGESLGAAYEFKFARWDARTIVSRAPDKVKILDPKHPLVQAALAAAAQLNARGAFKGSPAQQAYVDNLLAGARFFGIV